MGTKQAFKTYARGQRIQDTSVTFASGMSFTNAPLEEGFSRLLVNYDFGENGNTLKPRRGMQTTKEGLYAPTEGYGLPYPDSNSFLNDGMSIVAGNQITKNGKDYYQIIVGRIRDYDTNLKRYKGDAWVLTCTQDIVLGKLKSVVRYHQLNTTESGFCWFTKPNTVEASIHNTQLHESSYIKKHIGSFAFNGNYYYFCTDQKLHYTYFDEDREMFLTNTVTAYKPYQAETQNSLYNMLLEEPYTFENQQISGVLRLTGFMPTDSRGQTKLNPQNGVSYNYKMFYTYPTEGVEYCFHIEYNTGNTDTWYPIDRDESVAQAAGNEPFEFENIRVDSPFAQFRIFAIAKEDATFTVSNQLSLDALANSVVLTAAFNYRGAAETDSTTNAELTRYDLSASVGMTYWKNRLWVFGAKNRATGEADNTILFASEVNRPDWFPYTAGADIFDEEIICLQPMLDDLLVFTSRNLYSITLDAEGLSWTRKHLQTNLNLTSWDLNLIQIVKNMVFFKSGNYYYMVVPKLTAASGSGLAIAPVSKNITYLLNNFENTVKQIVDDLYNYSCYSRFGSRSKITFDLKLVHYYNFLDYEDVHNCYVFECTKRTKVAYSQQTKDFITEDQTVYLNFQLLYNTVNRTWRVYIVESERVRQPLFMNATGKGKYAELVKAGDMVSVQMLQYSDTALNDLYIKQDVSIYAVTPTPASIIQNWQYLDTGNLDQNSEVKKRFREYQFKISNATSNILQFYSGFILDRATRTYEMLYSYTEIEDDDDEESRTLVIDAQPTKGIQGTPTIQDAPVPEDPSSWDYTILGSWKLGVSKFPNTTSWKVRIPTSGKGYLPRLIFISYNTTEYELLSCATVYRQLYSR